jgi:AraC-like DNA-binding protein/Tfp pilus assembly protein PilF
MTKFKISLSKIHFVLCFFLVFFGSNYVCNAQKNNNIVTNFKYLSIQQLYDTANHYLHKNSFDTALVCYSLLTYRNIKDIEIDHLSTIVDAYNKKASLYLQMGNYSKAYELLITALQLCENNQFTSIECKIYNNIGNIYYYFEKYDVAKFYYSKALHLCEDSISMIVLLNNLSSVLANEKNDSALYYLDKSLKISVKKNNAFLSNIFGNIATGYTFKNQYDSANYYFRLSLVEAKKNNEVEMQAKSLSNIGKLFFELNKTDSALYYIRLSNAIATEHNLLRIISLNYLTLSEIEDSKSNTRKALKYYRQYSNLKDSLLSADKFGEINQLQRLYEVSKTDQQIEQLIKEQETKERTIHFQKIIWKITFSILMLISIVSVIIYLQKRKLNKSYKVLFEKNIEIIEFQENLSETSSQKYQKRTLTSNTQNALLDKILIVMEDPSVFCNMEFSLDKLADLVESNHAYVSQAINAVLNKNFRSFLNEYRIKEVQRLLLEPDANKFTIEYLAGRVGFRSLNAFRRAFKEITGVTPNYYLKSLQNKRQKM